MPSVEQRPKPADVRCVRYLKTNKTKGEIVSLVAERHALRMVRHPQDGHPTGHKTDFTFWRRRQERDGAIRWKRIRWQFKENSADASRTDIVIHHPWLKKSKCLLPVLVASMKSNRYYKADIGDSLADHPYPPKIYKWDSIRFRLKGHDRYGMICQVLS